MVYIRMLSYVLGKFENSDLDESSLRTWLAKEKLQIFWFYWELSFVRGWSAMSRDIRSNFCIRIVSRNIFFQNFPRFQEILNPFCPFNLSNRSIKKLLNINCAPRDCKYKYISLKENYSLQIISLEKKKNEKKFSNNFGQPFFLVEWMTKENDINNKTRWKISKNRWLCIARCILEASRWTCNS